MQYNNWRKERIQVKISRVYKLYKGDKLYNKEKYIYKLNLDYVPDLISFNDTKRQLVIRKFGESFANLSLKERLIYYNKCKELYYKFHADTGFYLYDYRPQNILIDKETGEMKLIDFEYYGINQDIWKSNVNFLKKIGVLNLNYIHND